MARKPQGWSPSTHRLVNGVNWSIGRNREALVALRGRNGSRVEEVRLVDKTRPRKRDWASNVILVRLEGKLESDTESHCVYRLCRSWWQRHSQLSEFDVDGHFVVRLLANGRYEVSLEVHGPRAREVHLKEQLGAPVVLSSNDPVRWETWGIQLLDVALCLLRGEEVDVYALHLSALTES